MIQHLEYSGFGTALKHSAFKHWGGSCYSVVFVFSQGSEDQEECLAEDTPSVGMEYDGQLQFEVSSIPANTYNPWHEGHHCLASD